VIIAKKPLKSIENWGGLRLMVYGTIRECGPEGGFLQKRQAGLILQGVFAIVETSLRHEGLGMHCCNAGLI
jgi:hypothetical protein